ncbi:MAG: response regulator [Planctomycetaceae bacterium]|nr:response regulator [Planctomycetaceae bacterium]
MIKRILAVDDDKSTCRFISKALTQHGYHVDTAMDGASALQLVAQHDYDLAVLDFHMPDVDGAQLFREIRATQPNMLAVFLTGDPTLGTVYPAIDSGAGRVLAKPIGIDELKQVVEEQLTTRATQ